MFASGAQMEDRNATRALATIGALFLAACTSGSGTPGTGGSGGGAGTIGTGGAAGQGGASGAAGAGGGIAGAGGGAGQGDGVACGAPTVDPEQVTGTPNWTAVAWAVFVAPLGTIDSPPATLAASESAVWAPKHVYDTGMNTFKSAVPHAPPYDGELAAGLAQTTFVNTGCFPASAFQAPSGVFVAGILVPSATAPTGSSYEVASDGPIISGELVVDGDLLRNGVVIDPAFDSTYPPAKTIYGGTVAYAGYRHMILNFAENSDFSGGAALTAGDYTFRVKISDGSGSSTSQLIHFTVN